MKKIFIVMMVALNFSACTSRMSANFAEGFGPPQHIECFSKEGNKIYVGDSTGEIMYREGATMSFNDKVTRENVVLSNMSCIIK